MPLYVTVTRSVSADESTQLDADFFNQLGQPMIEIEGELDGTGSTSIGDGSITTLKLVDDAVTNAKLANMASKTLKGNDGTSTGSPEDLTVSEVRAMLAVEADGTTLEHDTAAIRIKDGGVLNAKLADAAVTSEKLDCSPPTTITATSATLTAADALTFNCEPSDDATYTLDFATADEGKAILVRVCPQAASKSVSFVAGGDATEILWKGGAAPVLTETSGQTDLFSFVMIGTVIYGVAIQSFPGT